MKSLTVRCEKCNKNPKRLFDAEVLNGGVIIRIKCEKCGEINTINVEEYAKIHTEQIGAR